MKTIRLLGTTLMSVLLCVIFAACSKEGDNFYILSSDGVESSNPNYIIRYKTTDGVILRFENEDVFGGAKLISNKYSTTNGYGTLVFDSEVTAIESGAFSEKTTLSNITLPNSVVTIKSSAFSGCSKLKGLTIPNSVKSIGSSAFSGCSGLNSITIPDGVTSIGYDAFWGCSGLTSITIPDGVTSIGMEAFSNCDGLKSVYVKGSSPASVDYYYGDAFEYDIATLYVPKGSLEAYRNAYGWNKFENIQEWDAK